MSIEGTASNIRANSNPAFTAEDFLQMYPQFGNVPVPVLQAYVQMGSESVLESRWHSKWRVALGLYIAHFLTLWAQTASAVPMTPEQLSAKGESKGPVMSKGVDGVSISYGQTAGGSDLAGAGSFKDTLFGQQFLTLAKYSGFGGMYII